MGLMKAITSRDESDRLAEGLHDIGTDSLRRLDSKDRLSTAAAGISCFIGHGFAHH